jgi:hypothetical protein
VDRSPSLADRGDGGDGDRDGGDGEPVSRAADSQSTGGTVYTHPMKSAAQLEQEVLSLPADERARLALAAWESLETDPAFAADRTLDPEGIALALERDAEIEAGSVKPLSSAEFRQRTAGPKR